MSCLQCCSVTKSYLTLRDPMNCSMPSFSVPHYLPEFAQTPVHRVSEAIQPSHPQPPPSPPALNISQHQGLFQWVGSSYYGAKVLEFQLQHQSSNEIYSFSHVQTAETMAHSSWTSLISWNYLYWETDSEEGHIANFPWNYFPWNLLYITICPVSTVD